jgi:hypothetical protein
VGHAIAIIPTVADTIRKMSYMRHPRSLVPNRNTAARSEKYVPGILMSRMSR